MTKNQMVCDISRLITDVMMADGFPGREEIAMALSAVNVAIAMDRIEQLAGLGRDFIREEQRELRRRHAEKN